MFECILCEVTEYDPDVLEPMIGLAVEIAREGRGGRRIGTLFTLGMECCARHIRPVDFGSLVGAP